MDCVRSARKLPGNGAADKQGIERINPPVTFLSGVLPEEGSPPPSSTPDIKLKKPSAIAGGFFVWQLEGRIVRAHSCDARDDSN